MESQPERFLLKMQDAAASEASNYGFPGITVFVDLGRTNIRGTVAAGLADPQNGFKLTGKEPSRIASMTKTYTAAAILRLTETGRIHLDHSASNYLTNQTATLLESGGYKTSEITVRQLLQHTSGLPNHTDEAYQTFITQNPQYQWSRREQVKWALDHSKPIGSPGQMFSYSDTGYILLGEIIEQKTQLPQADAYRTLLRYDELGLHHTWFETLEPTPKDLPPVAHQFLGRVDATDLDPSFDLWGGGGLMATAEDAGKFLHALMTGKVFDHKSTLAEMVSIPATNEQSAYGMGIFRIGVAMDHDSKEDLMFWGHSGFFGTAFWYCPSEDITFVSDRHQAIAPKISYDPHSLVSTAVRIYGLARSPAQ